jgi:hypothetical protein
MILLFTILELLAAIAVLLILGMLAYLVFQVVILVNRVPTSGGGGGVVATAIQLEWIIKPTSFPKNTDAILTVQLQKLNALSGNWLGYDNKETLIGAVEPATVQIISINGNPPGTPQSVAELPTGVTVYKTTSDGTGNITFTLRGSAPADGQLFVFYVQSAIDVKQLKAEFSVTD